MGLGLSVGQVPQKKKDDMAQDVEESFQTIGVILRWWGFDV
jgi:hypothetical protein